MRPPLAIWSWAAQDQDASTNGLADARSIVLANFGTDAAACWNTSRAAALGKPAGDVQSLKDFQSTDFRHWIGQTGETTGDPDAALSQSRKKLDMNKIIPPPHLIIGEEGISAKLDIRKIREHTIASYLTSNVNEVLKNVNGRLTWIIPITRKLPCRKRITSAAMALDENDTHGVTASQARATLTHGTPELIAWTPQDLLIFWLWLRDTLKQGIFGSLTLSVTSMKLPKSAEEIEADRAAASRASGCKRRSSRRIHYIALHHGSTYSLRLRSYMAYFDPERMATLLLPESKKVLAENSTQPALKRAVLKNAKLLLVDREQKGVLVG